MTFPANSGSLRFCLHTALVFWGESDIVSCLIDAAADINEQLRVPFSKTMWWGLLKMLSFRHHWSPSALTYLAYHHDGATPLMCAILTGKYDAVLVLLKAGARLDIRNGRGKTAADFVAEIKAPISLEDSHSEADSDETISI